MKKKNEFLVVQTEKQNEQAVKEMGAKLNGCGRDFWGGEKKISKICRKSPGDPILFLFYLFIYFSLKTN